MCAFFSPEILKAGAVKGLTAWVFFCLSHSSHLCSLFLSVPLSRSFFVLKLKVSALADIL